MNRPADLIFSFVPTLALFPFAPVLFPFPPVLFLPAFVLFLVPINLLLFLLDTSGIAVFPYTRRCIVMFLSAFSLYPSAFVLFFLAAAGSVRVMSHGCCNSVEPCRSALQ